MMLPDFLSVSPVLNDGDCFYRCLAIMPEAFDSCSEQKPTPDRIVELRKMVAERLDEDALNEYQCLAAANLEGYQWAAGLSLQEARAAIVGDAERGPRVFAPRYRDSSQPPPKRARRKGRTVWADERAVNTLCEELNIELYMHQSSGTSDPYSILEPEAPKVEGKEQRRCLLLAKRPGHYDLLQYEGRSVFSLAALPKGLSKLWGGERGAL